MLAVSIQARHTFTLLILTCDDFGRCDARPSILMASLYPAGDVKPKQLDDWIGELEAQGCVRRYLSGGRPYLELTSWERYRGKSKRAKESRFPDPEDEYSASPEIRGDPRESEDPRVGVRSRCKEVVEGQTPPRRAPRTTDKPPTVPFPESFPDEVIRDLLDHAIDRGIDERFARAQLEACRDWALGNGTRKVDWIATIRGWIRRAWIDGGREIMSPDDRDDLGRTRSQQAAARRQAISEIEQARAH